MSVDAAGVEGNPFGAPATGPQAKRGPGRPPGAPNKKRSHHKKLVPGATREAAPKREPAIVPRYVYEGVGLFVLGGNALANFGLPHIRDREGNPMWTAADALTGTEIGRLTKALGDEALTNRELAEWLTKVGKAAGNNVHAQLFMAIASIAMPRLARRGMLPEEFIGAINAIQSATTDGIPIGGGPPPPAGAVPVGAPTETGFDFDGGGAPGDDFPPVPVASGGTPDDDRGYGEREVQPGGVSEPRASVVRDVPQQSGHRAVRRAAGQNGHGAGEPEVSPAGAGARP